MLETILNNFHLEKILWILQKRIAYIMILPANILSKCVLSIMAIIRKRVL